MYNPGNYSYSSPASANGYAAQSFNTNVSTNWIYLGTGKEGSTYQMYLVSESSVGDLTLYGRTGYNNSIDELNKICSIFGKGYGAIGAYCPTYDNLINIVYTPRFYKFAGMFLAEKYKHSESNSNVPENSRDYYYGMWKISSYPYSGQYENSETDRDGEYITTDGHRYLIYAPVGGASQVEDSDFGTLHPIVVLKYDLNTSGKNSNGQWVLN